MTDGSNIQMSDDHVPLLNCAEVRFHHSLFPYEAYIELIDYQMLNYIYIQREIYTVGQIANIY